MTYHDSARQPVNVESIEQHIADFHRRRMYRRRREREHLRTEYDTRFGSSSLYEFSKRFKQALAAALIVLPCLLFAQEPPPTPQSVFLRELGRPGNHYQLPITVTVTQTVTTVYELDYMRYIRTRLGPSNVVVMKTNYVQMLGTSVVSCVTNSSPVVPE